MTLTAALTRRRLLQLGAVAGGAALVPRYLMPRAADATPLPGGTLDPTTIPKYVESLFVPPVMRPTATLAGGIDSYDIAVRQFTQQLLPRTLPATTVWGYGSLTTGGAPSTPSATIEARYGSPVRVRWVNGLVDARGRFVPHLLPVDPTLHWANPPGGTRGRDTRPAFGSTPGPYTGPVPMVTHLHGAHVTDDSDGYPEAWYLPAAADIPRGYATEGGWYARFRAAARSRHGVEWAPGSATFQYPNDQAATGLWFHDHTLGMTRANVYAGPVGLYFLRGGPNDLPAGMLPGGAQEIPLVIQDRCFNADGSLFYPASRLFFDGYGGPYIPDSDVPPIWNPEFFANTMLVNGRTWPVLKVEPRPYRFRVLNGCGSRFVILKLAAKVSSKPKDPMLPFLRIGSDGGFLRTPVQLGAMLLAPSERADVIVDFSGLRPGTEIFLVNEGPDEPFGGGTPGVDFAIADPDTTGQVLKIVVGTAITRGDGGGAGPFDSLVLPAPDATPATGKVRQVSLNELASTVTDGPAEAQLGTLNPDGTGQPFMWMDPVTETPSAGVPEVWEIHNTTEDAHPIHLHQTQFQILDRRPFDGAARSAEPWEAGPKDTAISYPGEVTRLAARFDIAGRYVWHCHILEHEDNEMMRPLEVK